MLFVWYSATDVSLCWSSTSCISFIYLHSRKTISETVLVLTSISIWICHVLYCQEWQNDKVTELQCKSCEKNWLIPANAHFWMHPKMHVKTLLLLLFEHDWYFFNNLCFCSIQDLKTDFCHSILFHFSAKKDINNVFIGKLGEMLSLVPKMKHEWSYKVLKHVPSNGGLFFTSV